MVRSHLMSESGGVTIRPWEPRDRESVQRLLRLLAAEAPVVSQDAPTFVAQQGTEVVGMVTLCVFRTLTGPKAYPDHLVVVAELRRRGIARELVEDAILRARAAGASRIDLTASEQKRAGRALYESLGFQQRDTRSFRLHIDR